jgi:uncharacterized membrane protein YhfC
MYYFLYSLNFLLMIIMPLILGWIIYRRRGARWSLFLIGSVTFVLSQVGHIPFNLIAVPRLSDLLGGSSELFSLLVMSIFLGLSAGVFEEGARYLTYRYWAKNARSFGQGLMLGAGHGGGEAIILGVLVGINFFFYFAFSAGLLTAIVPNEQQPQLQNLLDTLFTAPWYSTVLGAVERFFTLFVHLALSVMVLQVFTRGRILWLFLAIGWHALVDAVVVFVSGTWGPYAAEGVVALVALISVFILIRLRKPEPEEPILEPLPAPGPVGPIEVKVTRDKLDNSRYS